jgi:protoheme IX farnesyltransferase
VLILDAIFLRYAWALRKGGRVELPMRTFKYSVNYLMLLFALLLVDHYVPVLA